MSSLVEALLLEAGERRDSMCLALLSTHRACRMRPDPEALRGAEDQAVRWATVQGWGRGVKSAWFGFFFELLG